MPPVKNPGYTASFVFDSTIASAGNDKKQYQNTSGFILEVYAIMGAVAIFSSANSNSNAAAYELTDATNASTTICGRQMFRVRFEGSETGPWHDSTTGVKYSNLVGTAQKPMYLQTPFRIMPGESITCQLFNDSGSSVRDQIDLLCRRIPIDQAA